MGSKQTFLAFREFLKKHICFLLTCLAVLVISFIFLFVLSQRFDKNFNSKEDGVPAPHIERDGMIYFSRGEAEYELPKGYEYAGEVFDGSSGYGKLYVNPEQSHQLYFLPNDWNVERQGPRPYVIFVDETEKWKE
jgi:hypothetical protein